MNQPALFDGSLLFVPAAGVAEAAARLFALTGATDPGTRGPKRSLEALAGALGVEVDLAATNAVLGAQLAEATGVDWRDGREYTGLQVTLDGLNALLLGATRRLWDTSRQASVSAESYRDVLLTLPSFRPAGDKQEAVDRLSDLAEVPRDRLGPGGKEHKVTFEALADRYAADILSDPVASRTKHSLVEALCRRFQVPFLSSGASTGQTVTLEGLNLLLAGAERWLSVDSGGWGSAEEEAAALLRVLRYGLPDRWDGRATVAQMHAEGSRNWRQSEWPGFYFEEQVGALLNVAYPTPPVGGPRRTYGSTAFDYASATRVWDAKAHTVLEILDPSGRQVSKARDAAILNDADAVEACLTEQGLGFLILDGAATYDETQRFDDWHRTYTRQGRSAPSYTSNSGRHNRRKAAFQPAALRALWIRDLHALHAGITGGWMVRRPQGAQQARAGQQRGAERNEKYHLKVHVSAAWEVASEAWS